jgi:hypothetical protein
VPATATYPGGLVTATELPTTIDGAQPGDGSGTAPARNAQQEKVNAEVIALEAEMGVNPAGSFVDLATRQNARITCRKTADSAAITSTTLVNVTDLSFALAANTDYSFEFFCPHTTGAAMGTGWAVTAGGTVTRILYVVEIFGHTANSATGTDTTVVGVATASGTKISNTPTAGLTTTAARIRGSIQQGATGGTLQVQCSRGGGATAVNVVVLKGADGWLQAA